MAIPYRCTVTIAGTEFDAISTSFKIGSKTDYNNLAMQGSLHTSMWVYADFHDANNLPFAKLKDLFDLANVVTPQKVKPMKVEFWKGDDKQDALASISFDGWISSFETSNLNENTIDKTYLDRAENDTYTEGIPPLLNDMLAIELTPSLSKTHFTNLKFGN